MLAMGKTISPFSSSERWFKGKQEHYYFIRTERYSMQLFHLFATKPSKVFFSLVKRKPVLICISAIFKFEDEFPSLILISFSSLAHSLGMGGLFSVPIFPSFLRIWVPGSAQIIQSPPSPKLFHCPSFAVFILYIIEHM